MRVYGYIYLITNKVNGKQYVGQTVRTIKNRFDGHISDKNMYISRAIRKYGKENFKIEEIDIAYNQIELNLIEGVYMSWFNTLRPNGYNIKEIIDGKGNHSEETKQKMSKLAKKTKRLIESSKNGKKRRGKGLGGKSKYCGVSLYKKNYMSQISFENKRIHLGNFKNEIEAAKAYDIKAIKLYGKDCNLNFPELREDYINGKIIVNKNTRQTYSKSGNYGIYFNKRDNRWVLKYFDKLLNKNRYKYFITIEKAIEFQREVN